MDAQTYEDALIEETSGKPTGQQHTHAHEGMVAATHAKVINPEAAEDSLAKVDELGGVSGMEEEVRELDKERNTHIGVSAAIDTKEDLDTVAGVPLDVLGNVEKPRKMTAVINDAYLNLGGVTIKEEDVATLEGTQMVASRMVATYFNKGSAADNAVSVASVMFGGAIEQVAIMDIVGDITGNTPIGTTDAMQSLADYMYGADAEGRLRAMQIVADRFESGDVHPSEFMQFNLLTALSGEDQDEGTAMNTINYMLDGLDAVPLIGGIAKLAKTGLRATAVDAVGYFKYQKTDTLRNIWKKLSPARRKAAKEELIKVKEAVEDTAQHGRSTSGAAHVISESDPEAGAQLKANIATADETIAPESTDARTGTTKHQVQQEMYPMTPPVEHTRTVPKGTQAVRDAVESRLDEPTLGMTDVYTKKEKAGAFRRAKDELLGFTKDIGQTTLASVNSFRVIGKGEHAVRDENGFEISGAVNDSDTGFTAEVLYGNYDSGFTTAKEAGNVLQQLLSERQIDNTTQITIVKRDAGTGKLRNADLEVEDIWPSTGEYYIQRIEEHFYSQDDLLGESVGLLRGYSNAIARTFISGASKVHETFLRQSQRMEDLAKAATAEMKELSPSLSGLGTQGKRALDAILEQGNVNKLEYNLQTLSEMLRNSYPKMSSDKMAKVIVAYKGFRELADVMLAKTNVALHAVMIQKGVKTLLNSTGGADELVIPIATSAKGAHELFTKLIAKQETIGNNTGHLKFWDTAGNQEIQVRSADDLYGILVDGDVQIYKTLDEELGYLPATNKFDNPEANMLNSPEGGSYLNLIVRNQDRIGDAPTNPVKKRAGWIPSGVEENVFVRIPMQRLVDGQVRQFSRTLGGYRNHREAKEAAAAYVDEIEKAVADKNFNAESMVIDKDTGTFKTIIDTDNRAADEHGGKLVEMYREGKMTVVPRKKDELRSSTRGLRLQSPIEAMEQATRTVGRMAGGQEAFTEATRTRFIKQYGSELISQDFNSAFKDPNSDVARMGEEFRRYVTDLHRVGEAPDEAIKGFVWKAARVLDEKFDNKVVTGIAETGYDLSRVIAPIAMTKSAVFGALIALAPARHIVMQASQFTFLAALDAKAAASGAKDGMLLFTAAMSKPDSAVFKQAVKSSGMPDEEFLYVLSQFKKSGIMDSMDSNLFQTENMFAASRAPARTALGQVVRDTGNILKAVPRGATAVGFNAGESMNLAMTYMFQAARMRNDGINLSKRVPGSEDNFIELATSAKQLALSPNKNGAYVWQRGWLSMATQFLGFQMKTAEFLFINKKNIKIDGKARAKLAGAQLALWGTEGWGISELVENAQEVYADTFNEPMPKELTNVVKGGAVDLAVNAIAGFISGEESTISVGHSMAPLPDTISGIISLYNHGFDDPRLIETFFGASGALESTVVNTFKDISAAFKGHDIEIEERAQMTSKAILAISPMLDKGMRAFLGGEFNDAIASKRTSEPMGIHFSLAEKLSYGLLGVSNYKALEYNHQQAGQRNRTKKIKSVADTVARAMNKYMLDYGLSAESLAKASDTFMPLGDVFTNGEDKLAFVLQVKKSLLISKTGQQTAFDRWTRRSLADTNAQDAMTRLMSRSPNLWSAEQTSKMEEFEPILKNGNQLANPGLVRTTTPEGVK